MCVQNNRAINWSKVTKLERKYSYPAYVEVANSQCDLMERMCDVSCCSDLDCSEEQKSSFECFGGLADGEQTESLTDWKCGDEYLDSGHFWSPLLCLVLQNTPYLGEYYNTPNKIESFSKLNVFLNNANKDSNPQTEVDNINNGTNHYKYGTPVRTQFVTGDNVVDNIDYLRLPIRLRGSAFCSDSSPVRFLHNTDSSCLRKVTMEECKKGPNSMLSAFNYMTGDTSNILEHDNIFPFVSKDAIGLNSTETTSHFLCLNNGSDYLRFAYSIFKSVPMAKEALLDNISFECNTTPAELMSTFYNASTETCEHVVISVSYYFTWHSTYLPHLEVTYMLADIPLTPESFMLATKNQYETITCPHHCNARNIPEFYVHQHFTTTFVSTVHETINGSSILKRSGNPGYDAGRPLLAWMVNSENDSDVQLHATKLGVWGYGEWKTGTINSVALALAN